MDFDLATCLKMILVLRHVSGSLQGGLSLQKGVLQDGLTENAAHSTKDMK